MQSQEYLIFLLITLAALATFLSKKLDFRGALVGCVVACCLYLGGGILLLCLLLFFFLSGVLASKWKLNEKQALHLAQQNRNQRSVSNVLANGGVAVIFALFTLLFPENRTIWVTMASVALSSACADTLASELGNIYGSRYWNILTFKKGIRGVDGSVSWEGTWAGAAGSLCMALIFYSFQSLVVPSVLVFLCGIFGCLIDSVLGATLQQRHMLNNHGVNFFSTLVVALLAGTLFIFF